MAGAVGGLEIVAIERTVRQALSPTSARIPASRPAGKKVVEAALDCSAVRALRARWAHALLASRVAREALSQRMIEVRAPRAAGDARCGAHVQQAEIANQLASRALGRLVRLARRAAVDAVGLMRALAVPALALSWRHPSVAADADARMAAPVRAARHDAVARVDSINLHVDNLRAGDNLRNTHAVLRDAEEGGKVAHEVVRVEEILSRHLEAQA